MAKELKDYSFVGDSCHVNIHCRIIANKSNSSPFVGVRIFNDNLKIFNDNNLQNYLSKELEVISSRINPAHTERLLVVCKLDDVEIEFWHEHSEEEVPKKWNKRKDRINYDKMIFIGKAPEGATTDFYKLIIDIDYDTITLYKKGKKKILKNFPHRDIKKTDWGHWSPIFKTSLKYKIALWWFIKYY